MPDPVTNNIGLTEPTVGGDLNIWGGILNSQVIAAIDAWAGNNLPLTGLTGGPLALTDAQIQNATFTLTGTLTSPLTITLPLNNNSATVAVGGKFVFINATTGNFTVTVLTVAVGSTGVTIPQGYAVEIYSDTVNVNYAVNGIPGFAAASNGNPNGLLAGTAGSVNTNASLAWDYVNFVLYVCTTTGNAAGAVWTNPVAGNLTQPELQGYLTLSNSAEPIPASDITATVLWYKAYTGTWAAVHNGTKIIPFQFNSVAVGLNLTSSQAANNIYDVFYAYNSGSPVIGTGPSWLGGSGGSITAGSCARGTGAGSTALQRDAVSGLWVNANSMSLIYNIASVNVTLTVPVGQGVYLGSIWMDANAGQITCHRSYGQSRKWGVWNAYNRVPIILQAGDPTASWTYNGTAVRASNANSNNNFSVFCGLPEEEADVSFTQKTLVDNETFTIGIGLNSTTAFSGTVGTTGNAIGPTSGITNMANADYTLLPSLGINTINALENATANTALGNFFGTQANMVLKGRYRG